MPLPGLRSNRLGRAEVRLRRFVLKAATSQLLAADFVERLRICALMGLFRCRVFIAQAYHQPNLNLYCSPVMNFAINPAVVRIAGAASLTVSVWAKPFSSSSGSRGRDCSWEA